MQPPPADPRRPAREAAQAALKAAAHLQAAGRAADAEAAFRRALAIDPHSAQACNNLGHHLLGEGRTSEAEALFRHALRIRPHYARALLNLGCILGQHSATAQDAVAMLAEATQLEPGLFHAWNNLGTALTTLCQAEAAEAAYRHAMTLEPRNPAAPLNLGALFFAAGRPAEAEAWFRQALTLDPSMAEARINLCFALLAQGRLREAWPLHAARAGIARAKSQTHWPDLPMPHWQGEPLAGKSIMVWPEQGYGDYIQFVRFVDALRARGASHITLVCTPPLHALLQTVEGVDRVVSGVADVPAHDYWAFVMSLPQGLDIGLEDIPARLPYIRAPADRVARWRGPLQEGPPARLKVGLAWRGSAGHRNDANRSLPGLSTLAPLWSVPGVRFVGLQKGKLPGQEDPDALAPPVAQPMLSLGPGMADFADLAAIVDQLDLVITVDTAVAHVAGALGKPVWVLLPAWGTDWRWMQDREDSPWYPGVMRLFRQRRHGEWDEVVQRVARALATFAPAPAIASVDGVPEADRLVREGRLDDAEPLLHRIVADGRASARAHHLLAHITARRGDNPEAEAHYRAGLALDDRQAGLHSDLGVLLMNTGRFAEAEACYRRAVAIDRACIEAWMNLAVMARFGGRFNESEAAWREALRIDPSRSVAQVGLGHLLLATGRLAEAWPWLRARHDPVFDRFGTRVPQLPFPRWAGEPLQGRSILLWPEQGLGDVIQFARYASLLHGLGAARVTLAAPAALVPVLGSLAEVDAVVPSTEPMTPHDTWAFLMDLPDRLGTTLENLPARVPYLRADPARVRAWRPRLPPGTLRVGLVWKGAPVNPNDTQRSLPGLATLAALWRVPGVAFISLQKGAGEDEAARPPESQPLTALGRELRDFADTAAVIDSLDLVIGVDTSVLHLAAALGKPAWILLPAWGTDWRWLVDRDDSPWYPGVVRLFRQREPGTWAAIVDEVAAALAAYADSARAAPGGVRPIALQLAVRSGRVVRPEAAEQARLADNDYAAATRLWRQGQLAEAEVLYRAALAREPTHASAHNNLANLMRQQRRLDEAEAQYRLALQADPRHLHALTNLGSLLAMQRRPDEAEPLLREALAIAPDSVDVLSNLGTLLDDVGRRDEAEALYQRALALDPDHAGALSNLGSLLMHQGRLEEAERHIRRALELQPRMTEALINLAFLLRALGRPQEAESTYRRALEIEPGNSLAELNLCFLLLAQGRLREAWPLHGARLQPQRRQVNTRVPTFPWPQWRGEPLQGRSLVIWPEQGLGDAIQFLRYARLLKQRGLARLTVVCQPSLAPLLRTLEGVDAVEVNVSAVPPHDFWVLLMDLPERFDTSLETIPADLPYLRPDPARLGQWSPRLPAGRRVGLVWRGSPGHRNDAHRSLPGLATLAPLWKVPGVQFVSLQKGAGEDEAAQPPAGQPVIDLGRHFSDFADAAAVVSQLDLVICVDTSVAHLAGALGKPVWLLLPRLGTDWRWLMNREDSPWYPGVMRLFRQRVVDDWAEVVGRIAQALPGFLATVRPQTTPEARVAADREVTRALALAASGKPMLAEIAYRRALASDPGHAGALNNLAVLIAAQGRTTEAETCWRDALAAHPDDGACLYNYGSHLADTQRLDEALPLLRRAALAWPDHASVRNNLARLLDRLGRLDEALAEYTRAHALAPRHTGVLANHAAALVAAGRPAQAEPLLREAIAIAPDAVDLQASLAVVLR
ncbi:tetratricopeptide repeat protein, partial [Ramlibacter sp.]|uniref:tetratricopeptide repeat protein n=1 Tax=Ramlibacter sp. TaxID=1917967 RepID=UPI0035AF4714